MQGPDATEVTRHLGSLHQANHYTFAQRQTYASISSQFYEVPKDLRLNGSSDVQDSSGRFRPRTL
jgi:hypothetical protein